MWDKFVGSNSRADRKHYLEELEKSKNSKHDKRATHKRSRRCRADRQSEWLSQELIDGKRWVWRELGLQTGLTRGGLDWATLLTGDYRWEQILVGDEHSVLYHVDS
jgi:hypothetical protein